MRRRTAGPTPSNGPVHLAAVETEVLSAFPQIVAHLVTTRYDDGSRRQTGTVTLRVMGSSWQAEARDFDAGLRLRVVGGTVDDALVLLDQLLGVETAPWEPDEYLQAKMTKKK